MSGCMMRSRRSVLIVLAAFGTWISWPSAAQAATLEINYATEIGTAVFSNSVSGWTGSSPNSGSLYAIGGFTQDGDKFRVKDTLSDSRRVAIHWRLTDGTRRGLCIDIFGVSENTQCDKDLPEGKTVEIRIGRCDGSTAVCESLGDYTNWSPFRSVSTS